jgi:5'-nucleotidase
MKPLLLLTNDDGYYAEGILALARCFKDTAETVVVAPDREKSATSLSLTLRRPLRVEKIRKGVFAVDGTPADCVYLSLKMVLQRDPDLIISGINCGPNLGQQDISYSGTVAAAIQGTFLGIPSLAVSSIPDARGRHDFDYAAGVVRRLAAKILRKRMPGGLTLNINIPPPPVKGARMTKLGEKRYEPEIIAKKDPREKTYYWIGSGKPTPIGDRASDVWSVQHGYISMTPLHTDLTDYSALAQPSWKRIVQGLA